jgi:NADH-quinone oxidoreductase subunit K
MITSTHYLVLSALLFGIGCIGVMVRKNLITLLLSIEIMLNAVNLNFIAFSHQWGNMLGQVFAIFVITVAAGEAAIGLGIIVAVYRMKGTVEADNVRELEG